MILIRSGILHESLIDVLAAVGGLIGITSATLYQRRFGVLAYLIIRNSLIAMIRVREVVRVSALFYLVPTLSAPFAWARIALAALDLMPVLSTAKA